MKHGTTDPQDMEKLFEIAFDILSDIGDDIEAMSPKEPGFATSWAEDAVWVPAWVRVPLDYIGEGVVSEDGTQVWDAEEGEWVPKAPEVRHEDQDK